MHSPYHNELLHGLYRSIFLFLYHKIYLYSSHNQQQPCYYHNFVLYQLHPLKVYLGLKLECWGFYHLLSVDYSYLCLLYACLDDLDEFEH